MASLFRMLSIGKEKKQSPPVQDIDAIKRSISGPRALAPKHIIDQRIEDRKARRLADQERRHNVSSSPSVAQPSSNQRHREASQATIKKLVKVEFAERPTELPATPTASTDGFGNRNRVTKKTENLLTVTLDRKSVASSFWCCIGPDEQGSSDQTVAQTAQSNDVITKSVQDAMLVVLEESLDDEPADPSVPRCGRDCPQCLAQMHMVSRRKASESGTNPQKWVTFRVFEDAKDATAEDRGYQRMSDAEVEEFIINELASRLYELSTEYQRAMESSPPS